MSERHEEVWAENARLSQRIINLEQRMLERILTLENEVAALKGGAQPARPVYEDAREINWCEEGTAQSVLRKIMQR